MHTARFRERLGRVGGGGGALLARVCVKGTHPARHTTKSVCSLAVQEQAA